MTYKALSLDGPLTLWQLIPQDKQCNFNNIQGSEDDKVGADSKIG